MNKPMVHTKNTVEDTVAPSLTTSQLGIDAQCVPVQPQGNGENSDNTNTVYIVLQGILYSLERNSDETDDEEPGGIKSINDGDEIWNIVLQLISMFALPFTHSDYQPPAILVKKIYKGEIKNVLGLEILEEEREIVLTCILVISLCCGEASVGNQWQLIAFRLISLLPIYYIKFFLQKMELHLNNLNADILKALVDRFKMDEDFVNLLHRIFARQEKLIGASTSKEILTILTFPDDPYVSFGDELNKENKLPEKAQIVMLNEMIAQTNKSINQKDRAKIIATIMNKADGGEKINQYLSSGIELSTPYIVIINEVMRNLDIPEINTRHQGNKNIYKR